MPTFAVSTVAAARWELSRGIREQRGWDDHAAFLDTLVANGTVLLGGPIGGSDRRAVGDTVARLAVEAVDEAAIHAAFADDPWIRDSIIELGEIEPWRLWLRPG